MVGGWGKEKGKSVNGLSSDQMLRLTYITPGKTCSCVDGCGASDEIVFARLVSARKNDDRLELT